MPGSTIAGGFSAATVGVAGLDSATIVGSEWMVEAQPVATSTISKPPMNQRDIVETPNRIEKLQPGFRCGWGFELNLLINQLAPNFLLSFSPNSSLIVCSEYLLIQIFAKAGWQWFSFD
jgi:hypothetical protein